VDYFFINGSSDAVIDLANVLNFESLNKDGVGDINLTGSNSDDLDVFVNDGSLFANAEIVNANINVFTGSVLGGEGTVGDVTISGGTLAPGNSIGTLTTGNLSFSADSTLAIEANDNGETDLVVVNGSVSLGGAALDVQEEVGSTFDGDDPFNFIIIDNDGSDAVSGTFGSVSNNLAFLTPSVDTAAGDGNDVQLSLTRNDAPTLPDDMPDTTPPVTETPPTVDAPLFPTVAETFNQVSTSTVLDGFEDSADADAQDVFMAILFTTTPQALEAFDSSSGEIYASLTADALDDQIKRLDRLTARSHESANSNAASLDQNSFGVNLGSDYRAKDNQWAAGATVGYFEGDLDDDRGSNTDVEGWHIGAYGRYGTSGAGATVTGTIGYSASNVDVARAINIGSLSRTATAQTDVDSFAATGEVRYGFEVSPGVSVGPVGSVRYADSDLDGVSETGAASLNLNSNGGGDSRTRFGGGGFVNWKLDKGAIDASVQYVDGRSNIAEIDLAFNAAAGTPFTVRSANTGGSGGLFSVAGEYEITEHLSVNGTVRGFYADDQQSTSASVGLGWRF